MSVIGAAAGQTTLPSSAKFTGGIATATSASDLNALITAADEQISPTTLTIDISGSIALDTQPAVANGESLTIVANVGTVTMLTAVPDIAAINLQSGVSLVIAGSNNAILDGENTVRGLFAYAGNVTVSNLTIQNTVAQGGSGSNAGFAGGGGAGLGGGLFVAAHANVTLNSVSFATTKALGGAGGNNTGGAGAGWGGGGGLGGNAGIVFGSYFSGGGGVGRTAFGGVGSNQANPNTDGSDKTGNPGPGIIVGGAGGGNGAFLASTDPHTTGAINGGGGGIAVGTGHNPSFPTPYHYYGGGAGGGGVGGHNGYSKSPGYNSKNAAGGGGKGGFGGGGGAGYYYGANGGFGGGGGAGQYAYGGNGGFGGGGGGLPDKAGTLARGGFGAGNAGGGYGIGNGQTPVYKLSGGDSGGGGLGAGGAVFVQSGGVLSLGGAGSLTGGLVTGGAGGVPTGTDGNGAGTDGTAGSAFGSSIFIQNDSTSVAQGVTFAPASGQTLTITGVIADEAGSGGTGGNLTLGNLLIQGGGTTRLTGANTFKGGASISAGSTLDLGASSAAGGGAITFASGSANQLLLEPAALTAGHLINTISAFAVGDTIEVGNIKATGSSYASGVLTLTEASGSVTLNLPGSFTTSDFVVTNGAAGADVSLACFAEGTRIRTERGMIAVESLQVGDRVPVALGNKPEPIIWLGHRRVDCRSHPKPTDIWPVCVRASAFGPGRPFRDLFLSPDHAVFINDVLIPIRYLVNGRTIRQQARDATTYWHVELANHNVLHAEGIPAESYLDTGNRSAFANGGPVMDLHADFASRVWEAGSCAPLILRGPRLTAAKRHLHNRANALGHRATIDAGLTILANDREVLAKRQARALHVRLPEGTKHIRLLSRIWIPAHLQPDANDTRTLGIAISRVRLDGAAINLDDACFTQGWHAPEQDWRWTDGDARLATFGARDLAFEVTMTGRYWQDEGQPMRATGA
jgi:hypothetical protein